MYTVFIDVEPNSKGVMVGRHFVELVADESQASEYYRENQGRVDKTVGRMDFEPSELVRCEHIANDIQRLAKIDITDFWMDRNISGLMSGDSDSWSDDRLVMCADIIEKAVAANAFCHSDAEEISRAVNRLRSPNRFTLPLVRGALQRAKNRTKKILETV